MKKENGQTPRWRRAQMQEFRRNIGGLLLAMMPMWAMFPALGLMILALSPQCNAWLLGGAVETGDALALLRIARRWYILILGAFVLAAALSVWMVVWAARRIGRRGQLAAIGGFLAIMVILCTGGELVLFGALIAIEELPQHVAQATEDIQSIEKDQLETAVCFVSPKSHPYRLPGPYTEGLPEPLVRYGVIGEDTQGEWIDLLVPNGLGFALEAGRLYDEDRSIGWNEENAQQYLVRYTVNLHIVVEITPWEGSGKIS